MKITTFYTTDSGESRFREITIPFDLEREDAFGHHITFSESYSSSNVHMALLPAGMDQDWHKPPARRVVVVRGGIDVVLHVPALCGRAFVNTIPEFPGLNGSHGGVRRGIPTQNQEFSPELGQISQFPVLIGHLEIRRRVSNVQQWHGVFSEKG